MTPSVIFSAANMTAIFMWILMIFLPRWKFSRVLIDFKIVPIALSLLYAIYMIQSLLSGIDLDFGSLASVMDLFTIESMALAGWIHYLAFDLLIGMVILDQRIEMGIHPTLMGLCLFLTFLLGPIGYLLFTRIKTIKNKQV